MAKMSGNMKSMLAILFTFIGCCANVVFLELAVVADPGSGNLVTFSQFLLISLEGFFTTMKLGKKKLGVPVREYFTLVLFFFIVSTTNNLVFGFNISMTLHLIFRAGSLMANMVLGMVIMGKRYNLIRYISVIMISIGIAVCTIASAREVGNTDRIVAEGDFSDYFWWVLGITILTFALFMSARMGLYQEVLYAKYGKHPREALFFTHFLPLPGFLLLYSDLAAHIVIANNSTPIEVIGLSVPSIWLYILGNILTQCICINSVFVLTTECTSLTVTLVVTLRKFLSLLFSIYYFNNPFTMAHWIGTACVFLGTILYSDIPALLKSSKTHTRASKKSN